MIFDQLAGVLFGSFSFSFLGFLTAFKVFASVDNIFVFIFLNLIFSLLIMVLGCILGYYNIFVYDKEDLGLFNERGIRPGDDNLKGGKNYSESIINDGD